MMADGGTNNKSGNHPPGHILHNTLLFAEVLRRVGLDVGTGEVLDLVRATEHVPIGQKQDFYRAARCLLVHRKQDLPVFDEAFQVFWRPPASGHTTRDLRSMGEQRRFRKPQVGPPPGADEPEGSIPGDDSDSPDRIDLTRTYSAQEVLRAKDFADYSPAEIASAKRMMEDLRWNLGHRRTRRRVAGPGRWLDLRKTLRRNLKYGGELLELAHRRPKVKTRPLVLICDVSGSMEQYTRMLLHFIHTIAGGTNHVEAFLFATRLTRITRHLNYRSVDQAVSEVSKAVPDWAGGTRIGQALKTFNFQWLRRVLGGGALVLIISDGWDRGAPELLARETSRLQRSCHRLVWLNPLLGSPTYQPLTQGMQAALPYVDDFLPANNLNSLEALALHLSQLNPQRAPVRRYQPPKAAEQAETQAAPRVESQVAETGPLPTFRHPVWGRRQ